MRDYQDHPGDGIVSQDHPLACQLVDPPGWWRELETPGRIAHFTLADTAVSLTACISVGCCGSVCRSLAGCWGLAGGLAKFTGHYISCLGCWRILGRSRLIQLLEHKVLGLVIIRFIIGTGFDQGKGKVSLDIVYFKKNRAPIIRAGSCPDTVLDLSLKLECGTSAAAEGTRQYGTLLVEFKGQDSIT
jgi:hypothetical protein